MQQQLRFCIIRAFSMDIEIFHFEVKENYLIRFHKLSKPNCYLNARDLLPVSLCVRVSSFCKGRFQLSSLSVLHNFYGLTWIDNCIKLSKLLLSSIVICILTKRCNNLERQFSQVTQSFSISNLYQKIYGSMVKASFLQ